MEIFDFALSEAEMRQIEALARPERAVVNAVGLAPAWD